ncbi:MAG: hypothetical protein Sapg2KO_13640 [Saprospiraceae bacterium]
MDSLQEQFIEKLEEQYGPWDKTTSRFGPTAFGKIAGDLCISASQFSKLIYGTATEGMYTRSIKNVERLKQSVALQNQLDQLRHSEQAIQAEIQQLQNSTRIGLIKVLGIGLGALLLGALIMYYWPKAEPIGFSPNTAINQHPLTPFFEQDFDADFDSPYLRASEVQDYCPCSAYEGRWSLSEEYKLPLPGNRKPGVYYMAKSADVRMKCAKSATGTDKGRVMNGYEYLINEIWVDTYQTPLSPLYFDKEQKAYTEEFNQLQFSKNPQFKKVATIHSFFFDKFEIFPDSIVRTGEPCGRFATDVDEQLAAQYEIDIKDILENVLGDLNKTDCQSAPNPFCDPNDLREKESVIAFDCVYTIQTENLGIGGGYPYQKGYRLEQQNYADNLTCVCE